ncbi:MAG TPA: DPP IV N-terminal domain-containing protein [Gemmatimonadaceae bacterium]|nr:DPP IV N-terminal domain-containing protein [Gemmatimonadaceae bacterium]
MTHASLVATLALASVALLPGVTTGQVTAADYDRAENLRQRLEGLVVGAPENPTWTDSTHFWYRRSVRGGNEFVSVDATTLEKRPSFDHARLASALGTAAKKSYTPITLPFNTFSLADSARFIEVTVDSVRWRCALADYACTRAQVRDQRGTPRQPGGGYYGAPPPWDEAPIASPDSTREASIRNYNLFVRQSGATAWTQLSFDGVEGDAYEWRTLAWSPDSKWIAAYRVKPGYRREIHYVMSSPEDQIQPKHSTRLYNKPGDVLDLEQPALFEVASKRQTVIDRSLFPNAYDVSRLEWRKDSHAVTFEYNQRGHQVFRVIEIETATGKPRAVINEETPTFFSYSGKRFRFDVADGKEVIWMSERDGWNHLYLYDGVTGRVKNQITKGEWVVRGVECVDTVARQIVFRASGMYAGKDPYFVHAYRINFDGTGLTSLTDADATHSVVFSPDRRFYVDTYSRVDLAPISELRRTSDHKVVKELERGDMTALVATGWRPPEVFTSKARDGKTDIWGVIIRPMGSAFNPSRKYPVIENIYAGPHDSFTPKAFGLQLAMQAQAELGFIVAQVDGMGTSNRSKAFHDVAWRNLGDAGFPDRILWHRAIAAKYPWYDTSRVGIYGTSAGGQNSMGALLFHPEFYKAAVSAVGCHDNRMDKIWWNEQWMGYPLGDHYSKASNVDNAWRLQGRLLLVVGEMDQNVDPASTMQVVNALIKANKTFDLLVIPGAGHGPGGAYGEKKRFDFFVHTLLGAEPPDRNRITTVKGDGSP